MPLALSGTGAGSAWLHCLSWCSRPEFCPQPHLERWDRVLGRFLFSSERNNQRMSNEAPDISNQMPDELSEWEIRLLADLADKRPEELNGTRSVVSKGVVAGLPAKGEIKM